MKFGQVQLVLYFDITGLCPYFQNLLTAADGDLVFGSVGRGIYRVVFYAVIQIDNKVSVFTAQV